MKVPRFWHREWVRVPSKYEEGETWSIPRWGWSEASEEEAEKMASERARLEEITAAQQRNLLEQER